MITEYVEENRILTDSDTGRNIQMISYILPKGLSEILDQRYREGYEKCQSELRNLIGE